MFPDKLKILQEFRTGTRVIPAKRNLYDQGEKCSELYNVMDGWVVLYVVLKSGERQILDIALPGAFIGYQSDLSAPMNHSAEAITPCSICMLPRREFSSLLRQHPSLSLRLNQIMADELSRSRAMLVNLGARPAYATLVNLFLMLYHRSREIFPDRAGPNTAYVPLTQEQIAATVGVTSVHISNLIKEFRNHHLGDFHTPLLTINDFNGLLKAACYDSVS